MPYSTSCKLGPYFPLSVWVGLRGGGAGLRGLKGALSSNVVINTPNGGFAQLVITHE